MNYDVDQTGIKNLCSAIVIAAIQDYEKSANKFRRMHKHESELNNDYVRACRKFKEETLPYKGLTPEEKKEIPEYNEAVARFRVGIRPYNYYISLRSKVDSTVIFFKSAWCSELCEALDIDSEDILPSLNRRGFNHLESEYQEQKRIKSGVRL